MTNDELNGRIEEWINEFRMVNDGLVSSFFSLSIYGNKYEEYVFC
jgi:hypothetical protein